MGGPAESRDPGGVTEHRSGSAAFLCTTATTERAAPLTASGGKGTGTDVQAMNVITAVLVQARPTGALLECAVGRSIADTHALCDCTHGCHAWLCGVTNVFALNCRKRQANAKRNLFAAVKCDIKR